MTEIDLPEEAPPRMRDSDFHKKVAATLRSKPDTWMRVKVGTTGPAARSLSYQIKNGTLVAYRPHGFFEAVSRTVDGEFCVYARYVGETK